MVNQYTGITNYYDLLMMSGYYDYHNIAKEAYSIVGNNCQIIELGAGTGLLAEKYIEIDQSCEFTGVDLTPSFLEIAKKRLGNKAKLIVANALTMELNTTFDVAISNAGVWLFISCGDRLELYHVRLNTYTLVVGRQKAAMLKGFFQLKLNSIHALMLPDMILVIHIPDVQANYNTKSCNIITGNRRLRFTIFI